MNTFGLTGRVFYLVVFNQLLTECYGSVGLNGLCLDEGTGMNKQDDL